MNLGFIFAAVLGASVVPAFGQAKPNTSVPHSGPARQVLAIVDQLTTAGVKRDVAALDKLYAQDYFHTNPDGTIMTKAEVLASYRTAPTATIDSDAHDQDRVQVHGNMAVVNSRVIIKGRLGEQPFTRVYRVTHVLRRAAGRWLAANSHATLMTQ